MTTSSTSIILGLTSNTKKKHNKESKRITTIDSKQGRGIEPCSDTNVKVIWKRNKD